MKPKYRSIVGMALVLPVLSQSLCAASIFWANSGTDFNLGVNWLGGTSPSANDSATFAGARTTNPVLSAPASVRGLVFSNAAAASYTISGSTVTLGSGGINASAVTSGTNAITAPLTLAAGGQTWSAGTGSTLAITPSSFTRSPGAAVSINTILGSGTISTSGITTTNGIVGAWAAVRSAGSSANNSTAGDTYATISAGNFAPYTGATPSTANTAWGGAVPSGGAGTVNYDVSGVGVLGATGLGRNVNTIRYTGTGARQPGNNAADLLTINGLMNSGTGTFTLGRNGANIANDYSFGILVGASNELVLAPVTGDITLYSFIKNNGANVGNVTVAGNNKVEFAGVNTYTGATTVAGGTLHLSGAGSINSSSGITINGGNAKYLHTSSVASTRTIALNHGTLDGTGTVGAVTVSDNSSSIIANGNGTTTALTLGALAFAGDATVNLSMAASAGLQVSGALATTPANGQVVLNVPNLLPNGLTNLISFGTFTGSPADFTANLTGLGARQFAGAVQLNGNNIAVNVSGESIVWTGTIGDTWQTATTGNDSGPNNWARKSAFTATNFWAADTVEFNDTYNLGSGNVAVTQTSVTLADAVAPATTTFNNSAINYEIGGLGIAAGSLIKNGSGTVILLNANTYTGVTTISQGKLQLGNGSTDGSIAGSASVTNNGILEFNLGGAVTAAHPISGTGSLIKKGFGSLTLTGASSYSGGTTIEEGLLVAGSTAMNGGPITLNTNGTLTFTGNGQTSTSTLTGSGYILNNTANTIVITGDHTGFNGSFTHNAASNNTQFNSAVSASQNASYNLSNGEIIFAANGDYTVKFGSLSSSAGNIRGGNTATGTTTVEVGNLGTDFIIAGNFNNGTTKVLSLQKVGIGTLTLSGGANYSGPTLVNAGALAFTTVPKTLGTSDFTVADGATLSVKAAAAGTTMLPTGNLTLGASNLNLDFNLLTPTVTQISTGSLTLNGALTVNLSGSTALGSGTYKLIDYTTLSGSGTLPTGTFSIGNRSTGIIVNNTVDTSIDLAVTTDTPKWTGLDSGAWVVGSTGPNSNWKLGGAGTATNYLDDDQVLFDDTATGTKAIVINSSSVLPALTTFDTSTTAYSLSGTAGIASGSLVKSGTGSVTITNANTYTGATTINAGALLLGDGTSDGSIAGTSAVTNNGTLAYNLLADQTANYPISGTGNVTKTGAGALTLAGAGTYSGGSTLNSGVINLIGNGTLGTGSIALASGTTLNINKNLALTNVVTGAGAIVNTGTLTNTGDFSGFSGTFTHNSDLVSVAFNSATTTSQNAAYIIAAPQGSVQGMIAGGNGDYTLKLGSLSGVANSLFRGGFTATGTTTLEIGNLGTDTDFAGSISNGTSKILAVTKVGSGTLTLSGASSHTGATLVSSGTLNVTGSLAAASAVTVNPGATLKGTGPVAGTVVGNGIIAPGTGAGTLTTGPATLTGTLAIEIDGATGDKLLSSGVINLAGVNLTVDLLSGGFSEPSYVIAEGTSINGTFSSVPSGYAVNIVSGGTGQQAVLTSTTAGYASWASTHAGGQTANLDFDSDGVTNGVEYFMNAAAGFTANPGIVGGSITWPNGGNIPSGAYDSQFVVQTSTNLTTWTPVAPGDPHLNNTAGSVTYTLPTPLSGKVFVRLMVIPN